MRLPEQPAAPAVGGARGGIETLVLSEPVRDAAFLESLPYARDFHQSPARMAWLCDRGVDVRLVVVCERGRPRTTALLERDSSGWTLWKGPAGEAPCAADLHEALGACTDLRPVRLVLQPEWADAEAVAAAGYRPTAPFATLLVETGGGDERILGRMSSSARSRVRRATAAGFVFADDPALVRPFYRIYASAMEEERSPDFASLEELETLVELSRVRLFAAVLEGEVAAASVCFVQGNGVEARYVATSRPHRQLAPMNFLHYETIRWAAGRGLEFLDLSGWATADADPKQRRINRFKAGFGGVPFEYPTFARR